ncbi:MAG: MBL fold metallo-hydrolase [Deltaproteobacteria bacterium]|nr:MBL fold metallo-hydrolase [Deltaproteobacteria bacterium]
MTAEQVRSKISAAIREAISIPLKSSDDVEQFLQKLPFHIRGSYGGNTSCVEIGAGDAFVLCDAGTGLRDFGNHVMASGQGVGKEYHIFLSHPHWDHIQGFPFFVPAYVPGNRIHVYGFHDALESVFQSQQKPPAFPVPLEYMRAAKTFTVLEPDREYEVAGFRVKGIKQSHPGDSYGYSFEKEGKKIVYATDSEYKEDVWDDDRKVVSFFRDADLLIFDAQYSFLDSAHVKENWGHSSNLLGIELSIAGNVKHLCLFHNEPACNDEELDRFLQDSRNYLQIYAETSPLKIDLAFDGMELDI